LLFVILGGVAVRGEDADVSLKTKWLTIKLANGNIASLVDNASGKDYLAKGVPAPLLQVRLAKDGGIDKNYAPTGMKWLKPGKLLQLDYGNIGVKETVKITSKKSHIRFEVVKSQPKGAVDLVLWGPYPVTINRTVGETVGVVYNKKFALGIQGLNIKTLGGYPRDRKFQDKLVVSSPKDKNVYDEFCENAVVRDKQRMWGTTAWRTDYGAVLQAF
jgi:hypothetical protein